MRGSVYSMELHADMKSAPKGAPVSPDAAPSLSALCFLRDALFSQIILFCLFSFRRIFSPSTAFA